MLNGLTQQQRNAGYQDGGVEGVSYPRAQQAGIGTTLGGSAQSLDGQALQTGSIHTQHRQHAVDIALGHHRGQEDPQRAWAHQVHGAADQHLRIGTDGDFCNLLRGCDATLVHTHAARQLCKTHLPCFTDDCRSGEALGRLQCNLGEDGVAILVCGCGLVG